MGIKFNSNSVFPTLWDKAETSVFISAASLTVCFKINHPLWIINTAFSVRFVIIKSLFVCFQWWLICFPFSCLVIQLWRKTKPADNLQILVRTEQSEELCISKYAAEKVHRPRDILQWGFLCTEKTLGYKLFPHWKVLRLAHWSPGTQALTIKHNFNEDHIKKGWDRSEGNFMSSAIYFLSLFGSRGSESAILKAIKAIIPPAFSITDAIESFWHFSLGLSSVRLAW